MDFVIAVDGPAASGKGTVAQALATLFGLPYLDTGLLYRAVGVRLTAAGENLEDEAAAEKAAGQITAQDLEQSTVRTRAAGEAASRVAVHPGVRAALLDFQRGFAATPGGAVLDGRDIGTVIAPLAAAKLYVTASAPVRAERRRKQLLALGEKVSLDDVLADIHRRDARDGGRNLAPMVVADDAVLLDTTDLTIPRAFDDARRIVEAAHARWEKSLKG